jgi:hypothetical protein
MSTFDLSRPYTTRDGRKAFATVGPDGRLYGWAAQPGGGIESWEAEGYDAESWEADGCYRMPGDPEPCAWDLVNPDVPILTIKTFINVYRHIDGGSYFFGSSNSTRADADACSKSLDGVTRIACIEREISYVVGEGLNQ